MFHISLGPECHSGKQVQGRKQLCNTDDNINTTIITINNFIDNSDKDKNYNNTEDIYIYIDMH